MFLNPAFEFSDILTLSFNHSGSDSETLKNFEKGLVPAFAKKRQVKPPAKATGAAPETTTDAFSIPEWKKKLLEKKQAKFASVVPTPATTATPSESAFKHAPAAQGLSSRAAPATKPAAIPKITTTSETPAASNSPEWKKKLKQRAPVEAAMPATPAAPAATQPDAGKAIPEWQQKLKQRAPVKAATPPASPAPQPDADKSIPDWQKKLKQRASIKAMTSSASPGPKADTGKSGISELQKRFLSKKSIESKEAAPSSQVSTEDQNIKTEQLNVHAQDESNTREKPKFQIQEVPSAEKSKSKNVETEHELLEEEKKVEKEREAARKVEISRLEGRSSLSRELAVDEMGAGTMKEAGISDATPAVSTAPTVYEEEEAVEEELVIDEDGNEEFAVEKTLATRRKSGKKSRAMSEYTIEEIVDEGSEEYEEEFIEDEGYEEEVFEDGDNAPASTPTERSTIYEEVIEDSEEFEEEEIVG